jgi:S1-C subfamily serine protease
MTIRHACGAVSCLLVAAAMGVAGAADSPQRTAAAAARKVVKIYGAGGVRGLEAYQSGIVVSPDGRIVTAMSTVLDSDEIDCVLDDGRRFRAELVGVDPRRELAVLSIDATDLPSFALGTGGRVSTGTRIMALSNLFGVAVGDERVSVQRGVVAAVVPLEARRGAAEAAYAGDVYVLDCTTNNPGSPGGAVVDAEGRFLGMLGKELRSTASGIWLNYALPADEIARGCAAILAGGDTVAAAALRPAPLDARLLGVVLVPDLLDRTPPFVEAVLPGSAAARAGVAADDLVVAVGSRAVASRAAVQAALGAVAPGDPVRLTLVRDGAVIECDVGPRPGDRGRP